MGMWPAWSIFLVGDSKLSPSQSGSFGRATILTKIVLLIWWSSFYWVHFIHEPNCHWVHPLIPLYLSSLHISLIDLSRPHLSHRSLLPSPIPAQPHRHRPSSIGTRLLHRRWPLTIWHCDGVQIMLSLGAAHEEARVVGGSSSAPPECE